MNDPQPAPPPTAREQLLRSGKRALGIGGVAASSAASFAYRAALPLMALYVARGNDDFDESDATPTEIKTRNRATTKAAGTKALIELIEIASVTHPLYEGSTPYISRSDGVYQPPHMRHILALAQAALTLFARDRDEGKDPDDNGAEPPPDPRHSVAYIAVAPGEYQYVSGPLSPTAMRRSAMRERSYSQPQLAMLARQSNQYSIQGASGDRGTGRALTAQQYGREALSFGSMRGARSGRECGCGGSCGSPASCGCGGSSACGCASCGGGAIQFPPARRGENGECASLFSISCDTKWRLRECFKQSLCDLLRCLGDELCDDGKFANSPDLGDCLEGFVCSLVNCLPEAICPPPPPSTICLTQVPDDCGCNFAVGR